MRTHTPLRARWALALWLGGITLLLWLVVSGVITWCTAKTMDRYLEQENSRHAANVTASAQLQRLAQDPLLREEAGPYWIWDGANTSWLSNQFGGGLLRPTHQEPQTAVAIYDAAGNLLEKSENAFYIYYITEENWYTQASDMDYDGVAKVLYEPAQIHQIALQVIQRRDAFALRFTGTVEEGCMNRVSKIEYIDKAAYRSLQDRYYRNGSYQRHIQIQEMEALYGLTWQTLMASSQDSAGQQVYYVLDGDVSYYDPGKPLTVEGVRYEDLMAYLLHTDIFSPYNDYFTKKQGNLWDTLITGVQTVYREENGTYLPAYRVAAAVRYSPIGLALESLVYVYLGLFLLLALAALVLHRILYRRLILPTEAFLSAARQDWQPMTYPRDHSLRWQEARQLREQNSLVRSRQAADRAELSRLQAALTYAREAEENRRQMISALAHELKTPLAVIHSYAEGLQARIAEEKREQYLNVILSEAERTDSMVLELLDLSRLEAGKVKLSQDEFSLIALTQAIFQKLELSAQAKSLAVTFAFPPAFTVTADEGRIAQVIENFATNAIKYTPAGGRIHVAIENRRGTAIFSMENDSPPLSEEALSRIWDTFYRADTARSSGGTGLGLAIARQIIQLHGGSCSAENTGTGLRFRFTVRA